MTVAGNINTQELLDVVVAFYNVEWVPKDDAYEKADTIFKALDANMDGSLDEK